MHKDLVDDFVWKFYFIYYLYKIASITLSEYVYNIIIVAH